MILDIVIFLIVLFTFILVFILIGIYVIFFSEKLNSYLKKNKYQRWSYLTTFLGFGPGARNSARWMSYIFSKMDNKDKNIFLYKKKIKLGIKILFIILAFFILFLIFSILSLKTIGGLT